MNESELKVICKIRVGSHLYGTNTKDSDEDFKGVFLPSTDDLFLGNYLGNCPKSIHFDTNKNNTKNTKDDVDCEYYSLQYFLKLLQNGQTCAIEMLFANDDNIIQTSEQWDYLVENRQKFITKNMKAFLGYARNQASKYSTKGRRMQVLEEVIKFLKQYIIAATLSNIYDLLPTMDYVRKYTEPRNNCRMYEICGRKFEETAGITYILSQLQLIYDNYGKRAIEAKTNCVDFKAVSHALRIAEELNELLTYKNIQFPLRDRQYLLDVKIGKHKIEDVQEFLEKYLANIELKIENSELPSKVNMDEFKEWIIRIYKNQCIAK